MTKVAIYCRVSTQDQNLENQKLVLTQYCKRMNWEFEIFEEKESSRKSRPVQWELYNKLLKKEFDGLVIYKFDRWARSTKELIDHIENLVSKEIKIYSYMENVDLNSSMGRAMFTVISAFAQLERDIIRERTLAGLARVRAQGKRLGRPRTRRKYDNINFIITHRGKCTCGYTTDLNNSGECKKCYVLRRGNNNNNGVISKTSVL